MKSEFLRRFLSFILAVLIAVNPVAVPLAYAVDATPSASATSTGGSSAAAQQSITANATVAPVTNQTATNSASVSSGTVANSNSGQNNSANNSASGSAAINTGTATASATTNNTINTNVLNASASATASSSADATPSAVPSIPATPSGATIQNDATLQSTTSANSTSGQNTASASGTAAVVSGDSVASAAVANLVNTNLVGSNYRFLIYNIYETQNGTINLNDIWKEIESQIGAAPEIFPGSPAGLTVNLSNNANVQSGVVAAATSGQNTASSSGNAVVVTGNSFASASLFNLVNTNAVGANFLFVVVNIFGTLNGDVVVPNKDKFTESLQTINANSAAPLVAGGVTIDNYARVEGSRVLAAANSGHNQSSGGGNQTTLTGNAHASATTIDVINTNISWQNWMSFIMNNFGNWKGSVQGWSSPSAHEQGAVDSQTTLSATPSGTLANFSSTPSSTISNSAIVTATVSAQANSGDNNANAGGSTTIQTGRAVALANMINFINTNILGGNFLLAFINLFGHWNGSLIFAYPDLQFTLSQNTTSVQPGQEVHLTASYTNTGYEDARNGKVNIILPTDMTYEDNSLGLTPSVSGSTYTFFVGNVPQKAGGQIILRLKVNNNISPDAVHASTSILEKLGNIIIPRVYADSRERSLTVSGKVETSDPQADQVNHSASATITVNFPQNNAQNGPSSLAVTSWENVGDFVYPGDIVTFEVTVKNTGTNTINNIVLSQDLHDGTTVSIGNTAFNVGKLESEKTVKINYGIMIPTDSEAGTYTSTISASGDAPSGHISSDVASNSFLIKIKGGGIVPTVSAQEKSVPGQNPASVLGTQTAPIQKPVMNNLPYLLVLGFAALWLVERIRRRKLEKKLQIALKGKK